MFKICSPKVAGMSKLNYWEKVVPALTSTKTTAVHYSTYVEDTSNDLKIEFSFRPRLGNLLAKIPVPKKSSSAFHWTAYERSFADMGPKL